MILNRKREEKKRDVELEREHLAKHSNSLGLFSRNENQREKETRMKDTYSLSHTLLLKEIVLGNRCRVASKQSISDTCMPSSGKVF